MKALILVGGYGTRLRPLTLSVPKPLIQFCNRPIIEYQIKALAEVGVRLIVLAVAHQKESIEDALAQLEKEYNVLIKLSVEEEPLLTAGPIKLAEKLLLEDMPGEVEPELVFVMNSDVIAEYPLAELTKFHKRCGKEGSICLTRVKNPSMFGVVIMKEGTARIQSFIEKPKDFVGDEINAGIYLFDRKKILDRIPPKRPVSIEKEIFPQMAEAGELNGFQMEDSYWADIGKPRDFLDGTALYLRSLREKFDQSQSTQTQATHTEATHTEATHTDTHTQSDRVLAANGPNVIGNVLIDGSARIHASSVLGPNVTVDSDCIIGEGCRVSNASLMSNVVLENYSKIDNTIVGWKSHIHRWVRIDGLSVLGQAVTVREGVFVNGALLLPHIDIKEDIPEPGRIVM